jgi:hypothetical protein
MEKTFNDVDAILQEFAGLPEPIGGLVGLASRAVAIATGTSNSMLAITVIAMIDRVPEFSGATTHDRIDHAPMSQGAAGKTTAAN